MVLGLGLAAGFGGGARVSGAPWVVALFLATTAVPVWRAWRGAWGTALRPAVIWSACALALSTASQVVGGFETLGSGRPWAGHLTYLATLFMLATGVAVLGARRPGNGAWAILMGLLTLVLLVPWLEGVGLLGRTTPLDRLRLEMPWSLFVGLLAFAGVSNYLPTRYGPAVLITSVGVSWEWLALVSGGWSPSSKATAWSGASWCFGVSAWLGWALARRRDQREVGVERLWGWYRDAWGAAWGLRILERFNAAAAMAGWPFRLGWAGPVEVEEGTTPAEIPDSLEEPARLTLMALLRRFADPDRLAEAAGPGSVS